MSIDEVQPWDELRELLESASRREIDTWLDQFGPSEVARVVSRLTREDQDALLTRLRPDDAADLVEQLPDAQAAEIVDRLDPADAAKIVHELKSDDQADLIGDLPADGAEAILAELPAEEAESVRALADYPEDSAGGLMVTEFLLFAEEQTVGDVLIDLRSQAATYSDYDVQYAYVRSAGGRLTGVLRLRDLLLSPEPMRIGELMIRDPLSISDRDDLADLGEFFEDHDFLGVPVVDAAGQMVGVVHRAAVDIARAERSDLDHLKQQGIVGGEELRGMPMLVRSRRRLAWLSVNVVLNIAAASVIAAYQDTLQAAIALAVFLPIISDMSGCSGNQAVAVSMRELTLGLIQPRDVMRVWLKEIGVGAINGLVLGVLVATAAWLWKSNVYLGLVVGSALALNTMIAVSIGGTVPLLLRRLKLDPALASGPVLTTVTDMCGFFLTLSFAGMALDRLAG